MTTLLIIGAGGHGQVVKELAVACGYESIDFLDDKAPKAVGKLNEAPYLAPNYDGVIVGIGNNTLRRSISEQLEKVVSLSLICSTTISLPSEPTADISSLFSIETILAPSRR